MYNNALNATTTQLWHNYYATTTQIQHNIHEIYEKADKVTEHDT